MNIFYLQNLQQATILYIVKQILEKLVGFASVKVLFLLPHSVRYFIFNFWIIIN